MRGRVSLLFGRWMSSLPLPPHTMLEMPALSPTMSSGRISSWIKREGESIQAGDAIAEVETDKATVSWDAQDDGYLARILVGTDASEIPVGTPVAVVVEDEQHLPAFVGYELSDSSVKNAVIASLSGTSAPSNEAHQDVKLEPHEPSMRSWPSVRRLLEKHGLQLAHVKGTGHKGTVTKEDALLAIERGTVPSPSMESTPIPSPKVSKETKRPDHGNEMPLVEGEVRIPHTNVRRVIARRLLESKQDIPHLYVRAEVTLDPLLELRKELKSSGTSVSVNDFVLRACALALREVPDANAYWDVGALEARFNDAVDISVAVATEGGLITPIVKAADEKTLEEISKDVKDLASRAREGKLRPEEFQGGSFSISNLGMFGIDQFNAIVNPPQACIMAVGAGTPQVVLRDGRPKSVTKMSVTLSADHRVYDGHVTSRFVDAFVNLMEHPVRLLGKGGHRAPAAAAH